MKKMLMTLGLAGLLTACGGGGSSGNSSPSASNSDVPAGCVNEASGPTFDLTTQNTAFHPKCLIVRSAQSIHVVNKDANLHNFSITGTSVSFDIQPNKTVNGQSAGVAPGTYQFFCKYHKALGMVGTIVVR